MTELPLAPVARIIRNAGAERVSADATGELALLMEQYGQSIVKEALKLARHADRKTVTAHDIRMAAEILK
jgi:histone H3/H4